MPATRLARTPKSLGFRKAGMGAVLWRKGAAGWSLPDVGVWFRSNGVDESGRARHEI